MRRLSVFSAFSEEWLLHLPCSVASILAVVHVGYYYSVLGAILCRVGQQPTRTPPGNREMGHEHRPGKVQSLPYRMGLLRDAASAVTRAMDPD